MSFATGTASSLTDLLTALRNACTAAGWTLAGNVLYKGACYAEVKIGNNGESGAPTSTMLHVRMGNGIDGSNALTDPMTSGTGPGIGFMRVGSSYPAWDWPVTYYIHVNASPDEVFLVVQYQAALRFQHLYFGKSPAPGSAGTGNWCFATMPELGTVTSYYRAENTAHANPGGLSYSTYQSRLLPVVPFWVETRQVAGSSGEACLSWQIHGAIDFVTDAAGWSDKNIGFTQVDTTYKRPVSASVCGRPLLEFTPNAWNNETLLVPIQIASPRPQNKTSIVGELRHVRLCRNDFINDGALITLGPDKWKIYPCYKKNASVRDGNGPVDHSGTVAVAIRYDGP